MRNCEVQFETISGSQKVKYYYRIELMDEGGFSVLYFSDIFFKSSALRPLRDLIDSKCIEMRKYNELNEITAEFYKHFSDRECDMLTVSCCIPLDGFDKVQFDTSPRDSKRAKKQETLEDILHEYYNNTTKKETLKRFNKRTASMVRLYSQKNIKF